jgi:hypothetical protein
MVKLVDELALNTFRGTLSVLGYPDNVYYPKYFALFCITRHSASIEEVKVVGECTRNEEKNTYLHKMESSETIAIEVFRNRSTIPFGRNIRLWTAFYLKHLHLPPVLRGLHQKVKLLLCENDVANQCRSFLRSVPLGKLTVDLFQQYIQEELLPGKRLSRRSVRR